MISCEATENATRILINNTLKSQLLATFIRRWKSFKKIPTRENGKYSGLANAAVAAISFVEVEFFALSTIRAFRRFNTMFRVQETRPNETCARSHKAFSWFENRWRRNRLNVIRQSEPTANERPEAESVAYTLLTAMLLS